MNDANLNKAASLRIPAAKKSAGAGNPPAANTIRHGLGQALQQLSSSAIRLHRYRNVRAQMLQGALSNLDCND